MNMVYFAETTAAKCKSLLQTHDEIIYSHGSISYKITHALETIAFDSSGLTAMVELKRIYQLIQSDAYIKIHAFTNKPDQVMQFSAEINEIKELINQSNVDGQIKQMSTSIERYFINSKKEITKELKDFLINPLLVVDVYTKTLKSSNDFDLFVFNSGKLNTPFSDLELFSPVYQWRDFNSLKANSHKLSDGVYFCFVDKVFGFVIKNGEQLITVTDKQEYKQARKFLSNLYVPYQKNKTDSGFYLPYSLITNRHDKNHVLQVYSGRESDTIEHEMNPVVLCDLMDLPTASMVYAVLMFEMLIKKYSENPSFFNALPLTNIGSSFIMNRAIEHKENRSLIKVDDVRHGNYHQRFPEKSYKAINLQLEELFSKDIDYKLLNLVKHHDQIFCPDESGRLVPYTDVIEYIENEYNTKKVLKLHAFDMTMIGTFEELEAMRFNVARHNYANLLEMKSKIFMCEQLPILHKYLEEKFYANLHNIEKYLGYSKLLTHEGQWNFLISKEHNANEYSGMNSRWLQLCISQKKENSSVKKCYKTGGKRHQNVMVYVKSVEQLSILLNVPVNQLPEALKLYSWENISHHCLHDPVDALWGIWEQRMICFKVVMSKSQYNAISKIKSLESLAGIGVVESN